MKQENQQELEQLCEVIRRTVPTERIYLFGSYAYGEPREDSDYDLYVVLPDDGPRPIEAAQRIHLAISPLKKRAVDVLAGRKSVFEHRRTAATIEKEVGQKGVLLYDRELRGQAMAQVG